MAPSVSLTPPPSTVRKRARVTFKGSVHAATTLTPATGKFVILHWRSRLPDGRTL